MRRKFLSAVGGGTAVAVVAGLVAGPGRIALAEPATMPTTAPVVRQATPPATASAAVTVPADSPIPHWFDELNDPDPAARGAARYQLMGMAATDLPVLREVVRRRVPAVTPAQGDALREVVAQVYLAGEHYVAIGSPEDVMHASPEHFIGVRPRAEAEFVDPFGNVPAERMGTEFGRRLPGFPAARALRDGDVVLNVILDLTVEPDRMPNLRTRSFVEFQPRVVAASGRPFTLLVLRDGQQVSVPIRPVDRPVVADARRIGEEGAALAVDAFVAARGQRADTYWQEQFAGLLSGDEVPSAHRPPVTIQ